MKHLYSCRKFNTEKIEISYEEIFDEDTKKMKIVYERFKNNLEKRQNMEDSTMGSNIVDSLYVHGYGYTAMKINLLIDWVFN